MNGWKTPPEVGIQLPETKVSAEIVTMSGPLVSARPDLNVGRKSDVVHVILRLLCLLTSVTAVSLMTTAKESATISLYGFSLPVYSKWSFSDSFELKSLKRTRCFPVVAIMTRLSTMGLQKNIRILFTLFRYLVGISAAVAAHSVLQLLISVSRLLRKSPVIPSRNHAWLIFVGDQAFAYAMMSAGSAASGVTNLNHTGIRHSALPNFCKPLHTFCDRVAVSISFTFFTCFLLASSAVLDVIWLSKF